MESFGEKRLNEPTHLTASTIAAPEEEATGSTENAEEAGVVQGAPGVDNKHDQTTSTTVVSEQDNTRPKQG